MEAIGGWIKDAHPNRNYRRLEDIAGNELRPDRIAYFEDYRRRYFNDRLVLGQGTEDILRTLHDHGGVPARWMDLGAGVTTLFWATAVKMPGEVAACDLVPEALHVLSSFKDGDEVPQCYRDALAMLGRSRQEFDAVRNLQWTYHIFDCLGPWPAPPAANAHDLITAIGCFGLAPDADGYANAFAAAAANLMPAGRFIGADWIRSALFVDLEGHDNRYISAKLSAACADRAGLELLSLKEIQIDGDLYYDAVIVWAFGNWRDVNE
jgi:hypothetical protein